LILLFANFGGDFQGVELFVREFDDDGPTATGNEVAEIMKNTQQANNGTGSE